MSDKLNREGHCLCGSVKIKAENINEHAGACHCNMCRRWGGGPLMGVDCGSDVAFEGEENITIFDSSNWAERGFCRKCGSHLFYRMKEMGKHIIPVGLFDDQEGIMLEHQVFIDKKPSIYSFANKTKDMTEAEIFSKFAPPE